MASDLRNPTEGATRRVLVVPLASVDVIPPRASAPGQEAEHNGLYTAAYKNLFDWASRIDQKVYQQKPMVLLATSPGGRGASNVLKIASESAPHFGMDVKATVSIPSFQDNFDVEKQELTNPDLITQIDHALQSLLGS